MDLTLKVEKREDRGKGPAGRLRRSGKIPGVLYGDGKESVALTIDPSGLAEILRSPTGQNTIFDLELGDSGQRRPVMIHEVQRNPVGYDLTHADFIRINMDRKVHVKVAVHLEGLPSGVKNQGGMLEFLHRDVSLECLPSHIPTHYELDVSELNVGQSLKVADLPIDPDQVRVLDDAATVIALVALPAAEREKEAEDEVAAEDAAAAPAADETAKPEEGGDDAS